MSDDEHLDKKGASKWTYTALKDIGVEYEETCVPLQHFTEAFKARLENADDLKNRKNIIMSETNYNLYWNFEVQLKNQNRQEELRTIRQELRKLNGAAAIGEIAEQARGRHEFETDSEESMRWKTNLKEFFKGLWMILQRSGKPGAGVYTQLFIAFSRIVSLYSEPGNMYRRGIMIDGKKINEEATVRFETVPSFMHSNSSDDSPSPTLDCSPSDESSDTSNESSDALNKSSDTSNESSDTPPESPPRAQIELDYTYEPKLLLVTQVTTYDSFRYGWKSGAEFKRKHMASKVKGQHGIQLLIEIERSLFRKNVFGCICIGTYIIITQLEVNQDYLQELRGGKIQNPVKVKFSKPYDFLKKDDRKEIMEFLILISCVQNIN